MYFRHIAFRVNTMIRKFGIRNFYCFKEGVEINFEFDGHVPDSIKKGKNVTSILGIKGANGSGKTNIIKALNFLKIFCFDSADSGLDSKIPFESFAKNTDSTEFYVDFEVLGRKYYYELEITKETVLREELYRKQSRKTLILKRELNRVTSSIQELAEIETIRLRSNASIISLFKKYEFKTAMPDLQIVNLFFQGVITNVNNIGYADPNFNSYLLSKDYYESSSLFDFVKDIIISADKGIKNIEIRENMNEKGEKIYYPIFSHEANGEIFFLTLSEESSGTQKLFEKLFRYRGALELGMLLAIDEFDIHLHAMLLPRILDLFLNDESNPKGAQFIFTAHNT
ncbi:MAG: AAA family ATPase, partial [Methyloprofundus sp.]|nr:AAA family ATPase [Methyloprofundus sp.]